MAENKPNLVTFKISEEDRDWAEYEQLRVKRAERVQFSQAQLFSRMKAAYIEGNSSEGLRTTGTAQEVQSAGTFQHTPGESEWVNRVLQILRSNKPGLASALKTNIQQFSDLARWWDERKSVEASPATAVPGERSATKEELGVADEIERDREAITAGIDAALLSLEELEKSRKRGKKGEGGAPRKAG